jgi:hypothetical protein
MEEVIEQKKFEDIWDMMQKRDMPELERKIDEYLRFWAEDGDTPAPAYPIIILDYDRPENINLISNADRVVEDIDLWGYSWGVNKRVIDSTGNLYCVDYINFGHPVGCVYPKEIERVIELEELTGLVSKGFRQHEDRIQASTSIREVFAIIGNA